MDRTTLVPAAVVVLVLVSGCAGFGSTGNGPAEPTGDATPTPTQASTPTQTGAVQYPDGWSTAGVDDPDAALAAHYRAMLTGPPATVAYRSRIREAENDRAANTTLAMRVDTESQRLYATLDGSRTQREVYFADGTLTQWSVENETVANRSSASFSRVTQSIDRGVLHSHLLLYTLERNGTAERAGTTGIVYNVTGVHDDTVSNTYGAATAAEGRVVVSERGRVLAVETTVTYTGGTITYQYGQTDIGATTVPTPNWMQRT